MTHHLSSREEQLVHPQVQPVDRADDVMGLPYAVACKVTVRGLWLRTDGIVVACTTTAPPLHQAWISIRPRQSGSTIPCCLKLRRLLVDTILDHWFEPSQHVLCILINLWVIQIFVNDFQLLFRRRRALKSR